MASMQGVAGPGRGDGGVSLHRVGVPAGPGSRRDPRDHPSGRPISDGIGPARMAARGAAGAQKDSVRQNHGLAAAA